MHIALYFFAAIGLLVTLLVLFVAFSWVWVRAVTKAVIRRRALTVPQSAIPAAT